MGRSDQIALDNLACHASEDSSLFVAEFAVRSFEALASEQWSGWMYLIPDWGTK
jgi:hypothetical protein